MHELTTWLSTPDLDAFPYEAVLEEFHRNGKHFVPDDVLRGLDRARSALPAIADPRKQLLDRFLDTALDKYDGRYDYLSYLALRMLPLPTVEDPVQDVMQAVWLRDRLLVLLVADALRFELSVADGDTDFLPELRPDERTTLKRCRLGLRTLRPVLQRLRLDVDAEAADPLRAARGVCADLQADESTGLRRTLRMSVLPVYVIHDEYLFIRVLQSFEATFAMIAVQLTAAVSAIGTGEPGQALRRLTEAEAGLREGAPLFSLLATMQVQAFRTFREYTEGASAVQSRNYKILESLCRRPDRTRLDSAAYESVPEIRHRVLAGQPNLDEALQRARRAGRVTDTERDELHAAMTLFAATLLHWRQTHYRIAVRMLGDRPGTGYTEGTPYLKAVRTIPVFPSVDGGGDGEER